MKTKANIPSFRYPKSYLGMLNEIIQNMEYDDQIRADTQYCNAGEDGQASPTMDTQLQEAAAAEGHSTMADLAWWHRLSDCLCPAVGISRVPVSGNFFN